MRVMILFSLLSAFAAHAGSRTEQTFKDPLTGKSGLYTAAFAERSAPKSQGLLLFFHGSGNTSGYAGVFENLQTVGREFNLVPVAIQAPNQAITWPEGPNSPNNKHVAYVKSFLDREIYAKHPEIDRDRLVLVGFSAGSTFLSGDFLPPGIRFHKGGAVMLCGGGGPVRMPPDVFQRLTPVEAQNFPLYFLIQKKDFLFPQTMQGISYWKSRSALVHAETPDDGGHCAFDFGTELRKGIRKLFDFSKTPPR